MSTGDRQRLRFKGYLAQTPLTGPETVHLDVTNACNLDCVTCWNYAPALAAPRSTAWKRQRIDPVLFHRVLAEVADAGAERVVLSGGGEPFTHPDLYDFIAAVKARGLGLTVITNGTLCDFDRVAALGVDQVLLNTAAGSAASYAAYHPNQPPQTFERILSGARRLAGTTRVNLVQVINRLNHLELVAMVEHAAQAQARVSFKVGDVPKGTESFALTEGMRLRVLLEQLPAARRRARQLKVGHNLDAYEAALRGQRDGPAPPCFAGYLYTRIGLDGRVSFCCAPIDAGSVADQPFETVWRGSGYQALRARLHAGEAFDACRRCGKHDMNFQAQRALQASLDAGDLDDEEAA